MSKKFHRIAVDVKADIIKRIKDDGIPVAQAAKEHGVHETTIYGWLGAGIKSAPSWSEFARVQKQKRELFELVGELTLRLSGAQKKN